MQRTIGRPCLLLALFLLVTQVSAEPIRSARLPILPEEAEAPREIVKRSESQPQPPQPQQHQQQPQPQQGVPQPQHLQQPADRPNPQRRAAEDQYGGYGMGYGGGGGGTFEYLNYVQEVNKFW